MTPGEPRAAPSAADSALHVAGVISLIRRSASLAFALCRRRRIHEVRARRRRDGNGRGTHCPRLSGRQRVPFVRARDERSRTLCVCPEIDTHGTHSGEAEGRGAADGRDTWLGALRGSGQRTLTFSARGPFGPWPTVKETVWPSRRASKGVPAHAD